MRIPFLSIILVIFLSFQSCSKDETTVPEVEQDDPIVMPEEEIEEETTSDVYFEFNVDANYHLSFFSEGYIIIHNSNGDLLDFMEYGDGSQLKFENNDTSNVSDKLTITQLTHIILGGGDDFYTITTYPLVDKGTIWSFEATDSSNNADGSFSLTINDMPNWEYYSISNKNGKGRTGSSYYQWFNNPEDAQPTINTSIDWYPENDFLVSILDGNLALKYADLLDVQQSDAIVLTSNDLLDFDSYLNVDLPDYEEFGTTVSGFQTDQDFDSGGFRVSSTSDYVYSEPPSTTQLGFLSRFNEYKISAYIKSEGYLYNVSHYGTTPNELILPTKGAFTITDDDLFSFNFNTDVSYIRQRSIWRTPQIFSNENNSTRWIVNGEAAIDTLVLPLPEEIISRYSNLDLELLIHDSTELIMQGENYQDYINNLFDRTVKIESGYVEEAMSFGISF